jgi:uncharacterized membrane protein (UPF0136 family)
MPTAWIIFIYGILVAAGGAFGYVRASSLPSLVAGLGSGVGLVCAAIVMMRGSYAVGWWIALVIAALLLLRFGSTAFGDNFKFMPGGLMILLSVIAIVALLMGRSAPPAG